MIRATLAQANHFVLQKNFLAAGATSVPQLVAELAGLPGEPAATPFLAARARLADFAPNQLITGLNQRGLINAVLLRSAPYVVDAGQYALLHAATARQRNQDFNAEFRLWGVETNAEIEQLGEAIMPLLGAEPATVETVAARLPAGAPQELTQTSRGGRVTRTSNVALTLRWLAATGRLAAVNIAPDWREETLAYAPLRQLYPDIDLSQPPGEAEAQKAVVRAYLAAFGPATEADISFWTGFGKSETARATSALSGETMLTMVEGIPGMLLMLKSQAGALRAVTAPDAPLINVLPANDPLPTAHRASRSRYLTAGPRLDRQVYSSSGETKPTILVNGQIAGVWDWSPEGLTWQLLAEVDPAVTPLIEAEVARVAQFLGVG